MGKYILRCLECGKRLREPYANACPDHDSLLRAEYQTREINPKKYPGMWRFIDWLPVEKPLEMIDTNPITYKSKAFAKEFSLSNLYVSFSGYWPEKNARINTCSFKELEAPATFQGAIERGRKILSIASAGNAARGFAQVSSIINVPLITVVPRRYLDAMWTTEEPKYVILVSVDGDYSDAIRVHGKLANLEGIVGCSAARNVGGRDGLGVVMLDYLFLMKRLPDHYFQAVGSGTGAIAAWETSKRVIRDGRFGKRLPKLHLSQNMPFAPMLSAWRAKRRRIVPEHDMSNSKKKIENMYATVLSNKNPMYSVKGGVYDALLETNGAMYGVTNGEAKSAKKLFESTEGIDLDPAAAVVVASLIQAVENRAINRNDTVLLNVTGGGFLRLKEDYSLFKIDPCLDISPDIQINEVERMVSECVKSLPSKEDKGATKWNS